MQYKLYDTVPTFSFFVKFSKKKYAYSTKPGNVP